MNTYKRFKGAAEGTGLTVYSPLKSGEPDRAYIFESAIDLLAFKLLAKQDKIQNSVLISMAGLKLNSLKSLCDKRFGLTSR